MTMPCGHAAFRINPTFIECKICDEEYPMCEMWNCRNIATVEVPSVDWETGEEEPLHACAECASKIGWSA